MTDTQQGYTVSQEQTLEKLRRELRTTRIFSAVSSVLMLCVLVGGFLVFSEVKGYIEQVWPMVEQLSAVDFAAIEDTMQSLDESLSAVDWECVSEQLGELDIEALNKAIAGLDTEEMTKALSNINTAADNLQKLSDSLKAFAAKFGF